MTPKSKKIIAIGGTLIIAAGISYLIYRRNVNKKNSILFLSLMDTLPKENTTAARNETENAAVADAKAKGTADITEAIKQYKVRTATFDGRTYSLNNTATVKSAVSVAASIAKSLNEAMSGLGTDMLKFSTAFKRIGSHGAFVIVNAVYKATYKEDLWKAIEGEEKLYKGAGNGWNATIGKLWDLPNYAPEISNVVKTFKD